MKLSSIIAKPLIFSLTFSAFFDTAFAQDGAQGGAGGESAAESSVTSSSSKKAAVLPEVVESNPIVSIVRSGLPLTQLRKELSGPSSLSKSDLRSITRSGNKNDLKNVAAALKSETAELGTISIVVKKGGSSKNSLSRAVAFKEISNIGSDSDYIKNISDALLDPTISTFGSNDDSTEDILAKVENAKKRAVVINKILTSFDGAEDNAELSTYLTSISSVENLKDPGISISTEALDAKANAIDSVIEDFAGVTDKSKSANLLADIVNATDDEIVDERVPRGDEQVVPAQRETPQAHRVRAPFGRVRDEDEDVTTRDREARRARRVFRRVRFAERKSRAEGFEVRLDESV